MRFKTDENMPNVAAEFLNAAGHEAAAAVSEGLGGANDETLIAACTNEDRVLITFDLDFANVTRYRPHDYRGIAVLRLPSQDIDSVAPALRRALDLMENEEIAGHLWIVEEGGVRIYEGD